MKILNKYVFTGGPRTGKTTLLKYFGKIGYQIVPEAATILIREHQKKNTEPPWRNPVKFQNDIVKTQLTLESQVKDTKATFVDRSIIDSIAYSHYYNITPPKQALEEVKKYKYKAVFLLDFVGYYQIDSVRIESFNEAEKIQSLLKKTYLDFGYNLIYVPPLSILERAHFILNKIKTIEVKKTTSIALQL